MSIQFSLGSKLSATEVTLYNNYRRSNRLEVNVSHVLVVTNPCSIDLVK